MAYGLQLLFLSFELFVFIKACYLISTTFLTIRFSSVYMPLGGHTFRLTLLSRLYRLKLYRPAFFGLHVL